MRTWSKVLSSKLNPESKWFWVRTFGGFLAIAPAVWYVSVLSSSLGETPEAPTPIFQYFVLAVTCLFLGHLCMQKGADEEERKRIRAVLKEVMKEIPHPQDYSELKRSLVPPTAQNQDEIEKIKSSWGRS
jgi:hypothetical protein